MGIETIAIAALVVSTVGTAVSYVSQKSAASKAEDKAKKQAAATAKYEKEMAAANAKALEEQAAGTAEQIRTASEHRQKVQRAAAAKAGMALGEGTAEDIITETGLLAEKDVETVLGEAKSKGELLKKQAAGRAPLLMQKAKDFGAQAKADAKAAGVAGAFKIAGQAISTAGVFSKQEVGADYVSLADPSKYNLGIDHSSILFNPYK